MVKAKDELINFDCECGSNVFVTYEAKVKGYTIKYGEVYGVKKMPESMVEIHALTMCTKCGQLIDCVILKEC